MLFRHIYACIHVCAHTLTHPPDLSLNLVQGSVGQDLGLPKAPEGIGLQEVPWQLAKGTPNPPILPYPRASASPPPSAAWSWSHSWILSCPPSISKSHLSNTLKSDHSVGTPSSRRWQSLTTSHQAWVLLLRVTLLEHLSFSLAVESGRGARLWTMKWGRCAPLSDHQHLTGSFPSASLTQPPWGHRVWAVEPWKEGL